MTKREKTVSRINPDLTSWLDKEIRQIDALKQQRYQEKGYTPFYTFPIGETVIELFHKRPQANTMYAGRMNFAIRVKDIEYTWAVTKQTSLYRELLGAMQNGKSKVVVVRIGQGLDTRWSLKN
jgi:hypothetical protein